MGVLMSLFKALKKARIRFEVNAPYMKHIKAHPEYENLTAEEKSQMRCGDASMKFIKNISKKWTGPESAKYFVTEGFYQTDLLPLLSPINYGILGINHVLHYYSDKNYQEYFVKNLKFPENLIKNVNGQYYDGDMNPITEKKAREIVSAYDEDIVYKKSLGLQHGAGVEKGTSADFDRIKDKWKTDFLAQKIVKQHPFFAHYNDTSLNVVRILTLYWDDEVYYLGAIYRIGAPGDFCDHVGDKSVFMQVLPDGSLPDFAFERGTYRVVKDIYGKKIEGRIPRYEEIKEILKENHRRYAHHRIIGWDITMDADDNIVCIEFNTDCPDVVNIQLMNGPVFGTKSRKGRPILDEMLRTTDGK